MESEDGKLGITSLGIKQEGAPPAAARMDAEVAYHTKAETHLWHTIALFLSSDENVKAAYAGEASLIMDKENLLTVQVGCFICEEPYQPKMIGRRCKGQPKGTLGYR